MGRTSNLAFLLLLLALAAENEVSNAETNITERIPPSVVENTFKECQHKIDDRDDRERDLANRGRVVKSSDRKADSSLMQNSETGPLVSSRERSQLIFEECSRELIEKYNLTTDEVHNGLASYPVSGQNHHTHTHACQNMQSQGSCDAKSKFRTASGRCNNLNNPTWGMAFECQRRLMPASYIGTAEIRKAVSGAPLPEPRTLSLNLHANLNRQTYDVTHMYMFFGQLLDHDIAFTPNSRTIDHKPIQCCPPTAVTHDQCMPILLAANDPFFSRFGETCMNFVRSAICPTCRLGFRQVFNELTSFIDASFVYGSLDSQTHALREHDGSGRMLIMRTSVGDLLPQILPTGDRCSFPATNDYCFRAGDFRVNQHTMLASLQTIFVRHHNRIADELRIINRQWDGERVFQETRRIVGAQVQVITYKEYLPITLGKIVMDFFQLPISDLGTTAYNPNIDPTLQLEFSTAGFRFGHSLINSVIANSPLNSTNGLRLLRHEFIQPFDLYKGIIGPLVSGASNSPAQELDRHLVEDVTNYMYRTRGSRFGLDLASLNINRGRDHGIPSYVDAVRFCSEGNIIIENFSDLFKQTYNDKYINNPENRLMTAQNALALRRNYNNVADVDMWPGILMEIPYSGAFVGPTAACLIGQQFHNWKYGDRFYFEHRHQAGSFTFQQRRELKKTTLSSILCLNSDALYLPANAMLFRSQNNPDIFCRSVKGIDLSYWRDRS